MEIPEEPSLRAYVSAVSEKIDHKGLYGAILLILYHSDIKENASTVLYMHQSY
jgi:hypothetical protein